MTTHCENKSCNGVVINRREWICSKCGLVQSYPSFDEGPSFFSDSQGNPSYSNHPPHGLVGELGSLVGKDRIGGKYSETKARSLNKIRWGERIDRQKRGENNGFYSVARQIMIQLNVPNPLRRDVFYYYKKLKRKAQLVGYSYENMAGGFILYVCRLNKYLISPDEIYKLPHTNKKVVRKICYFLARQFHTPLYS